MGLEAVLERIRLKGEAEAKEAIAKAEDEAKEIIEKARAEAAEREKRNEMLVEAEVARLKTQELSSSEIDARKIVLNAQKEILEKLRASVLAALRDLESAQRETLIKRLVEKAKLQIPSGKVRCAPPDAENVGKLSGYEVGPGIDCAGGFTVTSEDGSVTLDMRFESLLDDFWNARLMDITRRLFGED